MNLGHEKFREAINLTEEESEVGITEVTMDSGAHRWAIVIGGFRTKDDAEEAIKNLSGINVFTKITSQ